MEYFILVCVLYGMSSSGTLFAHVVLSQTQLAQAIAGESQAAFMAISPSDILSKFVGESEASMRDVFDKGRKQFNHRRHVDCVNSRNGFISNCSRMFHNSKCSI